jgi:hypothetical protein
MLILLAAATFIVAPVPKPANFGNWTVDCDNVLHCEAVGTPSDIDSIDGWMIRVSRGAKAEALPVIDIEPAITLADVPGALRLKIDGQSTEFGFDAEGNAVGNATSLIQAIAHARSAELVDNNGKLVSALSVRGASAALRWLDNRQRRAGTVTALVALGDRPASAVPPPPPLPRIIQPPTSKALPRQLRSKDVQEIRKLADNDCEPDAREVAMYRLDAHHTLGIVACTMGPYWSQSVIVVLDEAGQWRPAVIEQPELFDKEGDASQAYFLTSANYLEKERLLTTCEKARAMDDCDLSASWAWDGKQFRLASYQSGGLSLWQTANYPLSKK